jgi:thiol:disulfide interchange protein
MSRNWKVTGIVLIGFLALAVASALMRHGPGHAVDLPAVLAQSEKNGKPVLVDFWADWCGPCQEMRRTTWKDPRVRQAMNDYVLLEIDVDRNEKLAGQYGVRGIPHIAVLDSQGRVLKASEGFLSADELLAWLGSPGTPVSSVRLLDRAR